MPSTMVYWQAAMIPGISYEIIVPLQGYLGQTEVREHLILYSVPDNDFAGINSHHQLWHSNREKKEHFNLHYKLKLKA